jgi:hypothetical protein
MEMSELIHKYIRLKFNRLRMILFCIILIYNDLMNFRFEITEIKKIGHSYFRSNSDNYAE